MTQTANGPTLTSTQFANQTWAALVLVMVGAPVTTNNLANVMDWMTHENAASTWTGTAGVNNPLNNGLGSGGGSGLGSYPDLFTAAVYAAKGIEGGIFSSHCGGNAPGGIAAALKADAPFPIFKQAVIKSGWAGSCYPGWTETSPSNVPVVTVAQAAQHSSTHNPSVGNVTQADLGDPGLLQQAEQGVSSGVQGAASAVGSVFSWTEDLAKILGEIDTLAFWERFGMGVLGVGLLVFGAVLFFSSTKTGQRAITEGEKAGGDAAVAAAAA